MEKLATRSQNGFMGPELVSCKKYGGYILERRKYE